MRVAHITNCSIGIQSQTETFFYYSENQMSQSPVTYNRMDVVPEAKTCYYTDTVSYAGIIALVYYDSYYQFLSIFGIPQVQRFKILNL